MDDPIYPVIFFFLVLGAIIGWLLHGLLVRGQAGGQAAGADAGRVSALTAERDRLRGELAAARSATGAGDGEVAARLRSLEDELRRCREGAQAQQAEIARLEARVSTSPRVSTVQSAGGAKSAAADEGTPPPALPGPEGQADDLKLVSGIGPGIERTLNQLGIYHFHQIAAFTPDHVAWVDRRLRFKGRIGREKWIEQAKTLAAGGTTEFSRRQGGGDG